MIKENIEKALNTQINAEFYSAYMYLSMAAYFEGGNWKGFASWLTAQAKEEFEHGMKIFRYVFEKGGKVTLTAVNNPPTKWDNAIKVFEDVYAHEQKVTNMIYDIVNLSITEKDHATKNMLEWFVKEQVEEEAHSLEILEKLKLIDNSVQGLMILDGKLSARNG